MKHPLWRCWSRFPLPVITPSNVCSVSNKLDKLAQRAEHDCEFRQSNLVCLMKTWLKDHHETPSLPGYTTIRADRDERSSRKSIEGGACACSLMKAGLHNIAYECSLDYEILTVSLRPFYLQWDFGQITVILAYVPGPNDTAAG